MISDPQQDELDRMHKDQEHVDQLDDLNQRLALLGQLLTCAIAKLGGEMAVTHTEISRAVTGQQIAITPFPNDRGFFVELVSHQPGGNDVVPAAASPDVRSGARSRT